MSVHEHYRPCLGTALRHNQVAYAYSATTTALFGVLSDESEIPSVHWFSQRLPREPSEVVALGTALSVFSMAAGLGLGTLVAWLAGPWTAWPVAPLVASVGFLMLAGIEMGFAGYHHDAGGV